MNFKVKKIKPHKIEKPKREFKTVKINFPVVFSVAIIIFIVFGILKAIASINFGVFLQIAGADLKVDQYGHTNFLLLGAGGKNHDGGDLTDSIIIASLDNENKLVTILSIPRDLYVKDSVLGNSRINGIYLNAKKHYGSSSEGLNHLKEKVEGIAGVPIHYWIKVDFKGFQELVDSLGGIDVYVKKSIYDPEYPKDGTIYYETFKLAAGQQHLDGKTALKYARSRKTTSDFDRAERQQDILYAIKEKALSTETILDQEKIADVLSALKSNIETNITVKEILTLGSMAEDFSEKSITHRLIHDDPNSCGGFTYVPPRELYGGAFVLIPLGGFDLLHLYTGLNLNTPVTARDTTRIQILNGTKVGGIAAEMKQALQRFCFDITRFGNADFQDIEQTTYYYKQKFDEDGEEIDSRPKILDFLQTLIPGKESTDIPKGYFEKGYTADADLIMELGADFLRNPNKDLLFSTPK